MTDDMTQIVRYLLECSKPAVKDFCYKHRNRAAELLKLSRQALRDAAQEQALADLASIVDDYGEMIAALGSITIPEADEKKKPLQLCLPGKFPLRAGERGKETNATEESAVTTQPAPYHWRHELRRLRNAG